MSTAVEVEERQPGCLVTLLWFVFVGWWLSGLWAVVAWVLIVSIIGMPLGLMMLNRLPLIATLRRPASRYRVETTGEGTLVSAAPVEQRPFVLRAIWFLLVGWWLSALCLTIAWGASVTLIGLPVAIWLYNRIPAITTLARY